MIANVSKANCTLVTAGVLPTLFLSVEKCCVLTVTNRVNRIVRLHSSQRNYTEACITCQRIRCARWQEPQIRCALYEDHQKSLQGFVIRTSRNFRQLKSIIHLYRALVAPHHYDILTLVHHISGGYSHRFTRYVFKKFHYPYCDYETRCRQLELMTLQRRRILNDQIHQSPFIERFYGFII